MSAAQQHGFAGATLFPLELKRLGALGGGGAAAAPVTKPAASHTLVFLIYEGWLNWSESIGGVDSCR